MREIEIRTATPDDSAAIVSVLAASFIEYKSLYTEKAYAATTPDETAIKSRFGEGETWVAELENKIVGTVSVVKQNESLYIRSMAILPEARGHRIGNELLLVIERYAIANDLTRLTLSTTPFLDHAIRLYQNFGFVNYGTDDLFGTPLITMEKVIDARAK